MPDLGVVNRLHSLDSRFRGSQECARPSHTRPRRRVAGFCPLSGCRQAAPPVTALMVSSLTAHARRPEVILSGRAGTMFLRRFYTCQFDGFLRAAGDRVTWAHTRWRELASWRFLSAVSLVRTAVSSDKWVSSRNICHAIQS